jgi:hypothetical protein
MVVLLIEILLDRVYTVTSACPALVLERNVFHSLTAFFAEMKRNLHRMKETVCFGKRRGNRVRKVWRKCQKNSETI